jgi:hypothetical protein
MGLSGAFCAASLVGLVPVASAQTPGLNFQEIWSQVLPDAPNPIALSSPNVATLEGMPAIVVGDRKGDLYAFSLADGRPVPGWPLSTGVPIDSTPSVAALTSGSPDDTVFVGLGNASDPHAGGYEAVNPDGTMRWYVAVKNPSTDASAGATSAVMASLAVGDLQGGAPDVVAPSVGQEEYAIDALSGAKLSGFPWFSADSGFSTPALADLYGDGQTYIVEGGDQSAGLADGVMYTKGGHLRILAPTGNAGTSSGTGGLECQYNPDQGVESSPAVGQFLAGGGVGIVVGTGIWPHGSDADKVLALGTHCNLVWHATLNGFTQSSPALADIEGNGSLSVVEGTEGGPAGGSVYALDGANGSVLWQHAVGPVMGGVATADLGEGYQDVIAPTTDGAVVLDGKTGAVVATLAHWLGLQNVPLVTTDPNGKIGVTVAGYNGHHDGEIEHYELVGSSGSHADEVGAWPMFHHDPQLTGNAGITTVSSSVGGTASRYPTAAELLHPSCSVPVNWSNGYYMINSAGSVYAFGNVARCGSLPGHELASPVAGMASTPDGGGYWIADQTGKVFAFGDAKNFVPNAGATRPVKSRDPAVAAPSSVVAIAATPDGKGYWLADQDGRVTAFGDAPSYGPQTSLRLGQPIVGIAATANGRGYWLVSSGGEVFAFGDAHYHGGAAGGTTVGIAADDSTGGYWLVDSLGQVTAKDAPTYGSVPPGVGEHGVTGIVAQPDGSGYRLVDSGGSLICFGTATDLGSALVVNPHPTLAVVGMASP